MGNRLPYGLGRGSHRTGILGRHGLTGQTRRPIRLGTRGKKHRRIAFLNLEAGGQEGFRRRNRNPVIPLPENFRFRWSARYTF
jgi:hypothetical protein